MELKLVIDVALGIILLLFAVGGFARGLWPEVVALAGVLFGALLTEQWADAWGTDLSEMTGLVNADTARFIVRVLLFLLPLLAIGYAGALLLPHTLGKPNARLRLFGALLGLLNGAAILGFLLRAYQYTYNNRNPNSALMNGYVSRFLLEWAGWWVLALALGGSIVVLLRLILRPGKPRPTALPFTPTTTIASGKPAPETITPPQVRPLGLGDSSAPIAGSSTALPRPDLTGATATIPVPRPAPTVADSRPGPSDPTAFVPVGSPPISAPSTTIKPADGARPLQRCRTCGKELLPGAAFCTNCGTPVE